MVLYVRNGHLPCDLCPFLPGSFVANHDMINLSHVVWIDGIYHGCAFHCICDPSWQQKKTKSSHEKLSSSVFVLAESFILSKRCSYCGLWKFFLGQKVEQCEKIYLACQFGSHLLIICVFYIKLFNLFCRDIPTKWVHILLVRGSFRL